MVPAASPAARPLTIRAPTGRPPQRGSSSSSGGFFDAGAAQALTRTATAASRKKIPTMSLRASPAWSDRAGTLSAMAPSASDQGATPKGRPMHHTAAKHPMNQPRFSSGDSTSRSNASIPTAWNSSAVRRVEPRQKLRRDVVQVPGVATLKEPCGEWPVVPGGIEPGHPARQLRPDIQREMDDGEDGDPKRNQRRNATSLTMDDLPDRRGRVGVPPPSPHDQRYPEPESCDRDEIRHCLE